MNEPVAFFHFDGMACLLGLLRGGKIGTNAFALGSSLCVEIDRRTMATTIDVPTLARCAGLSPRSGFRARDELLSVGFISVSNRPGRSSVTTMHPCQIGNAPLPDWQRTLATEATHPCQIGSLYRYTDKQKKHTSGVADESAPPADREKAKRHTPTEADVTDILQTFAVLVKPAGTPKVKDRSGSKTQFRQTVTGLLKTIDKADLLQAVRNYALTERDNEAKYRAGAQSFFGPGAKLYRDYLPGAFEAPDPDADLTKEELDQDDRARQLAIEAAQPWEDNDD